MRKHYFPHPTIADQKIFSYEPFEKAVDPLRYPDYAQIVTSPMDLVRMEKKNAGDKYASVAAVLEDIHLLKSNAYLYNQGKIGEGRRREERSKG